MLATLVKNMSDGNERKWKSCIMVANTEPTSPLLKSYRVSNDNEIDLHKESISGKYEWLMLNVREEGVGHTPRKTDP